MAPGPPSVFSIQRAYQHVLQTAACPTGVCKDCRPQRMIVATDGWCVHSLVSCLAFRLGLDPLDLEQQQLLKVVFPSAVRPSVHSSLKAAFLHKELLKMSGHNMLSLHCLI